jgi:hypothetical protein
MYSTEVEATFVPASQNPDFHLLQQQLAELSRENALVGIRALIRKLRIASLTLHFESHRPVFQTVRTRTPQPLSPSQHAG